MGPWPERLSIPRRDSSAEERLGEDKVAICKPERVSTRNWTLLNLDPGLPVSTNKRSKCLLFNPPVLWSSVTAPQAHWESLSLFCKPRLSGSQGHHSLLSDAKPGPLMPLCFCVPECGRDMVFYYVEPASRPKPQMTKCEDSVCRIRGRNWPKSRNKEISQVTVHPIGLSQLQIQSVTGGTKSSYAGDSQAKDSTATCLALWFLISSSSNPGWHPPHLCPLCAISIKLDWTTLSEECTGKQESYSRTISGPLSGSCHLLGAGSSFQFFWMR